MNEIHYLAALIVAIWASHQAFVAKEGTPHTAIMAMTASGVLAFGSLSTTRLSNGTEFTFTSEPVAILFTLNALVAAIVVLTSIIGEYGDSTPTNTGAQNVDEQQFGAPDTE